MKKGVIKAPAPEFKASAAQSKGCGPELPDKAIAYTGCTGGVMRGTGAAIRGKKFMGSC